MSDFLAMDAAQVEQLDEAKTAEVLAAWVAARRVELPEALARSTSKLHARLARKSLYQLKSSGVTPAPAPPEAPAAPTSAAPPSDEFGGVLSTVLGSGERALFFARPVRGGGLELYQGILHDEFGILQLEAGRGTRDQWRRRMRELDADPSLRVLRVQWPRLKQELAWGYALNQALGTPLTQTAQAALTQLQLEPAASPAPLPPPPEAGDAALAARGAELFEAPEIAEWMPSEADLEAMANGQPAAGVAQAGLTAIARAAWARRVWAMAEVLDAHQQPEQASVARAVARTLPTEESPGAFGLRLYTRAAEKGLGQPATRLAPPDRLPPPLPRPR